MNKFRVINSLLLFLLSLSSSGCVRLASSVSLPCTPSNPVVSEGFGVNIHFTDALPGELKLLSDGGFSWVRMDFKWDATERERGLYDFSAYDRLLATLEPHRIRTLFILDYGNPLYDNGAPPRTEAARQAFARWAVAAAKHFAGREILWEVYNEPNHSLFWPPKPKVDEYIALALAVGRAFRESVPNEKLIGPATSEIDFDFVESCFKAGLLEYWSAVSIHPYRRSDPETAAGDYCRLRELLKSHAPKRQSSSGASSERVEIPIFASEWGYSAGWPNVGEERQGELLARAWLTNLSNGVSLSIWYDWRDDGADENEPEHHFGTVSNRYYENRDPIYEPKAAFFAAKTLTTFLNGYRFENRISTGRDDEYILVFRKGDELRYAAWTTARSAKDIMLPIKAGRYTAMGHTGQEKGTLNADQKGLMINLTKAPLYIRQVR